MKNFAAQIAGAATLALAILPIAALSTAAHAAPANLVQVADLNLATAQGVATLNHRVAAVANQFCGTEKNLALQAACKNGVRAEVQEKLAQRQTLLARAD